MVLAWEMRVEEPANALRPVTNPEDWCDVIEALVKEQPGVERCVNRVAHLDWRNLSAPWKRWFEEGLSK